MSGLKVIKAGVLSTIQDWGRYGQRLNGLSTGGPMDEHAFLWANHLLENNPKSAAIEMTVGFCVLKSQSNTTISICGADMGFQINNQPKSNWATHPIKAGDVLSFRSCKTGLRAYLAIKNGFNVDPFFSSVSTVTRENLGGLNGQALKETDFVPAENTNLFQHQKKIPTQFLPNYQKEVDIKFTPSYQFDLFDVPQHNAFVKNSFTVSQRMDRMGCRLEGEVIKYNGPGIISEGIAVGSIQIPPDGQPIILLKDSGSIGGYPKLGCVTRMDLNKLAQCRAGDKINFINCSIESATKKLIEFYRFFDLQL